MEEIVYKLDAFEGPLDLLVSFISKKKVDIREIKIAEICDQYLDYIDHVQKMDMEIAGEFLVMAADLMLLKSRLLLPKEEKAAKEEFVQKVMEYQAAQAAAKDLSDKENLYKGRYQKEMDEFKPVISEGFRLDANELLVAFHNVLIRMEEDLSNKKFRENPDLPITHRKMKSMESACAELTELFKTKRAVHFDNLFDDAKTKEDIISTFCAMLELLKVGVILLEKREESMGTNNNIILRYNENNDSQVKIDVEGY